MADYDTSRYAARPAAAAGAEIDQGLRSYMLSVYNYMTMGVALTGLVAYLVSSSESAVNLIFGTGLYWVALLAPLGLVVALSFGINRMSASTAQLLFWLYAGLNGLSLAVIFLIYPIADIARVFFITAAAFGALSLYGYTTPRSLSGMGTFMVMGLVGILLAMAVNFFLKSSGMTFVISILGVLIFAGLTAWDTQKIKERYYVGNSGEATAKSAVMGALDLYLDFINLFLLLLRLLGNQRN